MPLRSWHRTCSNTAQATPLNDGPLNNLSLILMFSYNRTRLYFEQTSIICPLAHGLGGIVIFPFSSGRPNDKQGQVVPETFVGKLFGLNNSAWRATKSRQLVAP